MESYEVYKRELVFSNPITNSHLFIGGFGLARDQIPKHDLAKLANMDEYPEPFLHGGRVRL